MKLFSLNQRRGLMVAGAITLIAAIGSVVFRIGPLAPTRLTVVQVTQDSLTPSVFGVGSVEAKQSWLMGPTVAGRVLRVHVDVGDKVKAGQLLAEMDAASKGGYAAARDAWAGPSRAASI